jgi:hypothetical protein
LGAVVRMTCVKCGTRPAPISGQSDLCALCRREQRREQETEWAIERAYRMARQAQKKAA